ncbi:MAG: autotransporter-associated beta strand repeat-containing protein [Verrucomicrobia bacterium]|nr:autotransporter-associated beta strand repeat-containing protein [Verrucomicrobiota bacterium]
MKAHLIFRNSRHLAAILSIAITTPHVKAVTWDGNGTATPSPSNSSGVWSNDTANKNWWDGSTNVSWTAGGDAIFGTGVHASGSAQVTLGSSSIQVNSITFNDGPVFQIIDPGSYTLSRSSGTLVITNNRTDGRTNYNSHPSLEPTITGGSVTFKGNGSSDLLELSYPNSFSGVVTLDGAGIYFRGDGALGNSSNDLSITGSSSITYGAAVTHGASRTISLASGSTLTLFGDDASRPTIQGEVRTSSGSATLQIGDYSVLTNYTATLEGSATFSGSLRLYGYLRVPSLTNLSPNAELVFGNGGNHTGASGDAGSILEGTGTFDRPVGTGAGKVRWLDSNGSGSGGFAAVGGDLTLRFGGNTDPLTWGTGGFLPNANSVLALQTNNSTGKLYFSNGIALAGAQRTIRVNLSSARPDGFRAAHLDGALTGNAASGLRKTGEGTLFLRGASTYGGTTTVSGGHLVADFATALGATTGGTVVESGAALAVGAGRTIADETVTIHGNGPFDMGALQVAMTGTTVGAVGEWQGDVRVGSDGARLGFAGVQSRILRISGRVVNDAAPAADTRLSVRADYGTVELTNDSNSFVMPKGIRVAVGKLSFTSIRNLGGGNSALGAPTSEDEGRIELGEGSGGGRLIYTGTGHSSNRALHLSGTTGGGTIEASGSGALVLSGPFTLASGGAKGLTLGGTSGQANEIAFSLTDGPDGATTLWKSGAGRWILTGSSSHTGTTYMNEGNLEIRGNLTASPVNVAANASLYGTGTCGKAVTVASAGRIVPGSATATGNLTVNGGTLAAGSNFISAINQGDKTCSRLTTTGPMTITGSNFYPDVVGSLAVLPTNTRFVVVSHPGVTVTGTFAGLPDGTLIEHVGNTYRINYGVDTDANGQPDAITLTALGDTYDVWAYNQGLSPAESSPDLDPDHDGIRNLIEFVLGSAANVPSAGILPKGTREGGSLIFRFNRTSASRAVTTQVCEWSVGGFVPWKQVPIGYDSYGPNADGVTVEIGTGDPHTVTVRIPATSPEVFARLKVSRP